MEKLSARSVVLISRFVGPEWSGRNNTQALLTTEDFCVVMRTDFTSDEHPFRAKDTALFLCWGNENKVEFKKMFGWGDLTVHAATIRRTLSHSERDGEAGTIILIEGYSGTGYNVKQSNFSFRWPLPEKSEPEAAA